MSNAINSPNGVGNFRCTAAVFFNDANGASNNACFILGASMVTVIA